MMETRTCFVGDNCVVVKAMKDPCVQRVEGKKRMQRNRETMSSSYSTTHFHPSILMHTNEMMI